MIKQFCDSCEKEITGDLDKDFEVSVIHGPRGVRVTLCAECMKTKVPEFLQINNIKQTGN